MYETNCFPCNATQKEKIDAWLNGKEKPFEVVGYQIDNVPKVFASRLQGQSESVLWITIKYI